MGNGFLNSYKRTIIYPLSSNTASLASDFSRRWWCKVRLCLRQAAPTRTKTSEDIV
jgi:hypothetical protein